MEHNLKIYYKFLIALQSGIIGCYSVYYALMGKQNANNF